MRQHLGMRQGGVSIDKKRAFAQGQCHEAIRDDRRGLGQRGVGDPNRAEAHACGALERHSERLQKSA